MNSQFIKNEQSDFSGMARDNASKFCTYDLGCSFLSGLRPKNLRYKGESYPIVKIDHTATALAPFIKHL
jgi:hypothetical protein